MKKLFFIPLFLVIACTSAKKEETDLKALRTEVLAIHDEVMPKMSELRRTRKALMLQADSIQTTDSLRAERLLFASDNLDAANESMREWMRNYEPAFEGTDAEILQYLNDQKAAITEVRSKMLGSLEEGKKLLEE